MAINDRQRISPTPQHWLNQWHEFMGGTVFDRPMAVCVQETDHCVMLEAQKLVN